MSHSRFIKAMFSFVIVAFLACVVYAAPRKGKVDVFCVGDSIILGNQGTYIYSDIMQSLFDKEYGTNKVSVYNYSFFDMNTAQCLKLVSDLLEKPDNNTEVVVIMAGEANYYNLNGITDYLTSIGQYTPHEAFIENYDLDAVRKLNTGVASMYNSSAAHSGKASLHYAFSIAYRSIAGTAPKKIGGYSPKVIPSFVALSDNPAPVLDFITFNAKYRAVWDFINAGKLKEAEVLLKEMLRDNNLDQSLYYTLGSLYLMEDSQKVNEALKMFQEGILVNPFDRSNACYKGLAVMYMSYDGRIVSEILYFARIMKSYLGEQIPEINAITAINTVNYDKKISVVQDWVISDIKKIDALCKSKNVQLIVVDYPLDAKVSALLKNALSFSNIIFVDNPVQAAGKGDKTSKIYVETARRIVETINKKNIIKK